MAQTRRIRRAPRSLSVSTTAHIDDEVYEVSASFTRGSAAYFDRSFGNWLPGDPDELEDIEVKREDGTEVDFDSFSKDDRDFIEEQLLDAVQAESQAAESDAADRAYDEWKDRQLERGDF